MLGSLGLDHGSAVVAPAGASRAGAGLVIVPYTVGSSLLSACLHIRLD